VCIARAPARVAYLARNLFHYFYIAIAMRAALRASHRRDGRTDGGARARARRGETRDTWTTTIRRRGELCADFRAIDAMASEREAAEAFAASN